MSKENSKIVIVVCARLSCINGMNHHPQTTCTRAQHCTAHTRYNVFTNSSPQVTFTRTFSKVRLLRYLFFLNETSQAFALDGVAIKWCKVDAWITALGLVSLLRLCTDCLTPKFLSTPLLRTRLQDRGRLRISRVEATSRITPRMMHILYRNI